MSEIITSEQPRVKRELAEPLRIIKQLFNYYQNRERDLINLLYQYGAPQSDIAKTLKVDQSVVARRYPKGDK